MILTMFSKAYEVAENSSVGDLIKAQMPEVPVSVDASCCAGVTVESHNNALSAMKMCQIAVVNG
jgi:hypothetical protein